MNSIGFNTFSSRSWSRGFSVLGTLGLISAVALTGGTARAAEAAAAAKTEVIFDHPENFKDIKTGSLSSEKGEQGQLEILRKGIVSTADNYLPDGCKLTMIFTDIDLAGDFEPWRGAQADDIRIIKDIYPPDYKFTWKVTDAGGRVLKEGKENLRDIDFQMKASSIDREEPLGNDLAVLNDWLRHNLRDLKKLVATK